MSLLSEILPGGAGQGLEINKLPLPDVSEYDAFVDATATPGGNVYNTFEDAVNAGHRKIYFTGGQKHTVTGIVTIDTMKPLPSGGTVSYTSGAGTITGSGTDFTTDFTDWLGFLPTSFFNAPVPVVLKDATNSLRLLIHTVTDATTLTVSVAQNQAGNISNGTLYFEDVRPIWWISDPNNPATIEIGDSYLYWGDGWLNDATAGIGDGWLNSRGNYSHTSNAINRHSADTTSFREYGDLRGMYLQFQSTYDPHLRQIVNQTDSLFYVSDVYGMDDYTARSSTNIYSGDARWDSTAWNIHVTRVFTHRVENIIFKADDTVTEPGTEWIPTSVNGNFDECLFTIDQYFNNVVIDLVNRSWTYDMYDFGAILIDSTISNEDSGTYMFGNMSIVINSFLGEGFYPWHIMPAIYHNCQLKSSWVGEEFLTISDSTFYDSTVAFNTATRAEQYFRNSQNGTIPTATRSANVIGCYEADGVTRVGDARTNNIKVEEATAALYRRFYRLLGVK